MVENPAPGEWPVRVSFWPTEDWLLSGCEGAGLGRRAGKEAPRKRGPAGAEPKAESRSRRPIRG